MLLLFLAMTLVRLLLLGVPDSVLTIHMICSSDVTLVTGKVCFLLHVKLVTASTVIGKPFEFLTQCVFAKAVVSCKLCFQTLYVYILYFLFLTVPTNCLYSVTENVSVLFPSSVASAELNPGN